MKLVTFLLFLASLVVMEYLLRKPNKKSGENPKAEQGTRRVADPFSTGATMPGLFALGQALDAHGRGKPPDVPKAPEAHLPPVDGV